MSMLNKSSTTHATSLATQQANAEQASKKAARNTSTTGSQRITAPEPVQRAGTEAEIQEFISSVSMGVASTASEALPPAEELNDKSSNVTTAADKDASAPETMSQFQRLLATLSAIMPQGQQVDVEVQLLRLAKDVQKTQAELQGISIEAETTKRQADISELNKKQEKIRKDQEAAARKAKSGNIFSKIIGIIGAIATIVSGAILTAVCPPAGAFVIAAGVFMAANEITSLATGGKSLMGVMGASSEFEKYFMIGLSAAVAIVSIGAAVKAAMKTALQKAAEKASQEMIKEAAGELAKVSSQAAAKETAKVVVREGSEEAAKEGAKEAVKKTIKDSVDAIVKKTLEASGKTAAEKAILKEALTEIADDVLKAAGKKLADTASKASAKDIGKALAKETAESIQSTIGQVGFKETTRETAKAALKKAGKEVTEENIKGFNTAAHSAEMATFKVGMQKVGAVVSGVQGAGTMANAVVQYDVAQAQIAVKKELANYKDLEALLEGMKEFLERSIKNMGDLETMVQALMEKAYESVKNKQTLLMSIKLKA